MQEQKRAARSKKIGEKNTERKKVLLIQAHNQKSSAQKTTGNKKREILFQKQKIKNKLGSLNLPETIRPQFNISPEMRGKNVILSICNASIGYNEKVLIQNIFLSITKKDRIALLGDNGSGKTTLLKAIMGAPFINKTGQWFLPEKKEIGYLDQHYENIVIHKTILETFEELMPNKSHSQIREYLNRYLFRKNEEVLKRISCLSGGEKVRLSLALIGISTPLLLILDELTNNLDLEIRNYVIQFISDYPGAILVVSHDRDFLKQIGIKNFLVIKDFSLKEVID